MSTFYRKKAPEEQDRVLKKLETEDRTRVSLARPGYPSRSQGVTGGVRSLSPSGMLQLQHTIGNRAVGQILRERSARQAAEIVQRTINPEEEVLESPGSEIRSGGLRRGEGYGLGKWPIGVPKDEKW